MSSYTAVDCANLYMIGTTTSYAENEILCQATAGQRVECRGIIEQPVICKVGRACTYGGKGTCGAIWGHNPCGLRRVKNYSPGSRIELFHLILQVGPVWQGPLVDDGEAPGRTHGDPLEQEFQQAGPRVGPKSCRVL